MCFLSSCSVGSHYSVIYHDFLTDLNITSLENQTPQKDPELPLVSKQGFPVQHIMHITINQRSKIICKAKYDSKSESK